MILFQVIVIILLIKVLAVLVNLYDQLQKDVQMCKALGTYREAIYRRQEIEDNVSL